MAIQKSEGNGNQGQGQGQGQQGMTTQRGGSQADQRSIARRQGQQGIGRIGQSSPLSLMRRMFDDLELGSMGLGRGLGIANPFMLMRRMFNDMERLFEGVDVSDVDQRMGGMLEWSPRVDVLRRDDRIVVTADLPGLSQDQIQIYAQDNALVIEGEREDVREDQRGDIWQSERTYGHFRRMVPLPQGVDIDNAEARFENGVLEVSVKLPEASRSRKIEIRGGKPGQVQGQVGQGQQNQPGQQQQQQQQQQPRERH